MEFYGFIIFRPCLLMISLVTSESYLIVGVLILGIWSKIGLLDAPSLRYI